MTYREVFERMMEGAIREMTREGERMIDSKFEDVAEIIVKTMELSREEALSMPTAQLNAQFEEAANELLEDVIGMSVKVTVTDSSAVKRLVWEGGRGFLRLLPEAMRDIFRINMANNLLEAGAELVDVDFEYRFAPKVTWLYQGEEYSAFFHLDGTFFKGDDWRLSNPYDHNLTSIVNAVAPEAKSR